MIFFKPYQKLGLLFFCLGVLMLIVNIFRIMLGYELTPLYFVGVALPTLVVGISIIVPQKVGNQIQIWLTSSISLIYILIYQNSDLAGGIFFVFSLYLMKKNKVKLKGLYLLIVFLCFFLVSIIKYFTMYDSFEVQNMIYNFILLSMIMLFFIGEDYGIL